MGDPDTQADARGRGALRVLSVAGPVVTGAVAAGLAVRFGTRWALEHDALFLTLDALVLVYFVADVALRAALAPRRLPHLRRRWFDLIVVLPLVQVPMGLGTAGAWFLVRQVAALGAASARTRPVARLASQLWLHPARLMVGSFAGAILAGTLLLSTPWASSSGTPVRPVDALFTATSATCVTGLIVKDTGSDFSLFGQTVILVLLQLGGLGIMTFSVSLALVLGRGLSKRRAVVMQDLLDQESVRDLLGLVRFIAVVTLLIEAAGAVALFACFASRQGLTWATAPRLAHVAVFHSISAFCNAGFSLFRTSFQGWQGDVWVNGVLAVLIVVGGLGFPVLRDLMLLGRRRRLAAGRAPGLRTHTKVVLVTSAALIVVGAVVFYFVDASHTLGGQPPRSQVLASFFQSITARTAGFNTVHIGSVGHAGLLLLMLLMFIGASPGSTGGGVKTTTAAAVWSSAWAALRGRPRAELFRRTVPRDVVRRAVALLTFSVLVLAVAGIALMSVEEQPFEDLAFELVSAFGTVGLSTGATPLLTDAGRLIITALMFIGRLGPLTLALLFVGEARHAAYAYPEERMMIG